MSKHVNLIGKKFGRLTVVQQVESKVYNDGSKCRQWLCKCDCGGEKKVITKSLVTGRTLSCGCLHKEKIVEASLVHGMSKTRLHKTWRGILHRCYNEKASHYERYGGRGILVYPEWQGTSGFINFMKWAHNNGYDDSLEIDRIDNDGNYEPSNCQWVTHKENCQNRHYPSTRKSALN